MLIRKGKHKLKLVMKLQILDSNEQNIQNSSAAGTTKLNCLNQLKIEIQ